jgi:hypothetical protein
MIEVTSSCDLPRTMASVSPQSLLAAQSLVERHCLQLVHDPRARLHHAMPVPQQLP